MGNRLHGKTAFITGTAGGQGRTAALLFAREGARVVGCDTKVTENIETVKMVRAAGGEMVSREPVDLADLAQAHAWIDMGIEAFGGIDILYNNAGAARFGPIASQREEDWSFTVRNELHLIFTVTQAAWPHLAKGGNGVIINTGSVAGLVAIEGQHGSAHAATKGAVLAVTRQLAGEGAAQGIRVNSVSPGLVRTAAVADFLADPDSAVSAIVRKIPLRRVGEPEDIANAALFLASDEASFITAANLVVDGGASVIHS